MIQIRTHHARWLCLATLGSLVGSASAGALYFEDFETGPAASGGNYTLTSEFINSSLNSHFVSTSTSTSIRSQYSTTSPDGDFISARNSNASSTEPTPTLTTASFDIYNITSLLFSFDLSRRSDGDVWAQTSRVDFDYSIDSGDWLSLTTVDTDGVDPGTPHFFGTNVNATFENFTTTLNGLSGDSMQLRITWADLGPGDSFAVDNITVAAVPLPPAVFGGLGLLGGLLVARRLRQS